MPEEGKDTMANDKRPEGFYVYGETEQWVNLLPDEIAGKVYKRLFAYHNRKEIPGFAPNSAEFMLFNVQKTKMDEYEAHIADVKRKQSKAYWDKRKGTKVQSTIVDHSQVQDGIHPILSNPILSSDYTLKYSPEDSNNASPSSASLEGRRKTKAKNNSERIMKGLLELASREGADD